MAVQTPIPRLITPLHPAKGAVQEEVLADESMSRAERPSIGSLPVPTRRLRVPLPPFQTGGEAAVRRLEGGLDVARVTGAGGVLGAVLRSSVLGELSPLTVPLHQGEVVADPARRPEVKGALHVEVNARVVVVGLRLVVRLGARKVEVQEVLGPVLRAVVRRAAALVTLHRAAPVLLPRVIPLLRRDSLAATVAVPTDGGLRRGLRLGVAVHGHEGVVGVGGATLEGDPRPGVMNAAALGDPTAVWLLAPGV